MGSGRGLDRRGRVGLVASTVGVGLAALLAIAALAFERWPFVAGFAALVVINVMTVREINRTRAQG